MHKYRATNQVADVLSRRACLLTCFEVELPVMDQRKEFYENDEDFGRVCVKQIKGKPLGKDSMVQDGHLFKHDHLCIPRSSLCHKLIRELHSIDVSGHVARDKTIANLKAHFFWPQLKGYVRKFVQRCSVCQTYNGHVQNTSLYMHLSDLTSPWEDISMNFVSCLPRTRHGSDVVFGG